MIIVHRGTVFFSFEDEPHSYGVMVCAYCIGYCEVGKKVVNFCLSALKLSDPSVEKGSLSHTLILARSCPTNSLSLTL